MQAFWLNALDAHPPSIFWSERASAPGIMPKRMPKRMAEGARSPPSQPGGRMNDDRGRGLETEGRADHRGHDVAKKTKNEPVLSIHGQRSGTVDENTAVRADPLAQVPTSATVGRMGKGRLHEVGQLQKVPMQRFAAVVAAHSRAHPYAHPLDETRATKILV